MELEKFGKERNRCEQWLLWQSREARPHGSGILYLHLCLYLDLHVFIFYLWLAPRRVPSNHELRWAASVTDDLYRVHALEAGSLNCRAQRGADIQGSSASSSCDFIAAAVLTELDALELHHSDTMLACRDRSRTALTSPGAYRTPDARRPASMMDALSPHGFDA